MEKSAKFTKKYLKLAKKNLTAQNFHAYHKHTKEKTVS